MEKKEYTLPEIEIIDLSDEMDCDTITASNGNADYGANGDEWEVTLF